MWSASYLTGLYWKHYEEALSMLCRDLIFVITNNILTLVMISCSKVALWELNAG